MLTAAMTSLILPIIVPFFAGILVLVVPSRFKYIKEFIVIVTLALLVVGATGLGYAPQQVALGGWLEADFLTLFIFIFIVFFGAVNAIYAMGSRSSEPRSNEFYAYFLWTIGASCGVIFSVNMLLFLSFWGFLGLTLYLMIGLGGSKAAGPAKKTMLIVGGVDALLILGLAMLFCLNLPALTSGELLLKLLTDPFSLSNALSLWAAQPVEGTYGVLSFLFLTFAAFSKAGAMPFHTWIPGASEHAPAVTASFLPASLDKLLGIYFFYRLCNKIFTFPPHSWVTFYLMAVGSITVFAAVMMALVQHKIRRLLGYHAVSQVGYMIIGIATLNPVGMAGGLFHMLNNAIYKSCLFLCAGNIEEATGTGELRKLGGLAKLMPLTFLAMLIAGLAISGVPPLNGFASKWLVYRGLIKAGQQGEPAWIIWLVAAMFGSALTLASFVKILHSIFWSTPSTKIALDQVKEMNYLRTLPVLVLAGLCIVFGVNYLFPLYVFIGPVVSSLQQFVAFNFFASWNAGVAAALIILSVLGGWLIYWLFGVIKDLRRTPPFVGGSRHDPDRAFYPGTEFYRTIDEMPLLAKIYKLQETGLFDVYEWSSKLSLSVANYLSRFHTGVLSTYMTWILVGFVIYLFVFMGLW